jgi:hypothetical protein
MPELSEASQQRRLFLRASIKILVTIGFLFLLVPFFKSLPWPTDEIPADSIFLNHSDLAEGETKQIHLAGGTSVFVTRSSSALHEQLNNFSRNNLWFPSAPGLVDQAYFVVRATTILNESLTFLPALNTWPGGFVSERGGAWDVAGRALKPWPGHPTGYVGNIQNLVPMPFRARSDGVLLVPPAETPPPQSHNEEQ